MCLRDVSPTRGPRRGFTLVEMLVVIAIIGVLAALAVPAVQMARAAARRSEDASKLTQVTKAILSLSTRFDTLPPAAGFDYGPVGPRASYGASATPVPPTPLIYALPDLEQRVLHDQIISPTSKPGGQGLEINPVPASTWWRKASVPAMYHMASDVSEDGPQYPTLTNELLGRSNVAINLQVFADYEKVIGNPKRRVLDPNLPAGRSALDARKRLPDSIPDGLTNTIMIGTKMGDCGRATGPYGKDGGGSGWASPRHLGIPPLANPSDTPVYTSAPFFGHAAYVPDENYSGLTFQEQPTESQCLPEYAQGLHSGLIQIGLCDGSVRNIPTTISQQSWRHAIMPDDGELLGVDW